MSDTLAYQQLGAAGRNRAHTLFAQTMGYVAVTAALFALGAWLGRDLTGGRGHRAVHRGLRRGGLRHPARPGRRRPDILNVFLFFLQIFSGSNRD